MLVVCRANHCRSPLAEHLLRRQVAERQLPWSVGSAGIAAEVDRAMHPAAVRVLRSRGIDARAWRSRRLTNSLVDAADLILTATEGHRDVLARTFPAALGRSFTLLQFAHLAGRVDQRFESSPDHFGEWLRDRVRAERSRTQPLPSSARNLPDPMGQASWKFLTCARTIDKGVQRMLTAAPAAQWQWDAPSPAGSESVA